jgi:hypothetical protein
MKAFLSSPVAFFGSTCRTARTLSVAAPLPPLLCSHAFFPPPALPSPQAGAGRAGERMRSQPPSAAAGFVELTTLSGGFLGRRGCCDNLLSVPVVLQTGHHSLFTPTGVPRKPFEEPTRLRHGSRLGTPGFAAAAPTRSRRHLRLTLPRADHSSSPAAHHDAPIILYALAATRFCPASFTFQSKSAAPAGTTSLSR